MSEQDNIKYHSSTPVTTHTWEYDHPHTNIFHAYKLVVERRGDQFWIRYKKQEPEYEHEIPLSREDVAPLIEMLNKAKE